MIKYKPSLELMFLFIGYGLGIMQHQEATKGLLIIGTNIAGMIIIYLMTKRGD